MKSLTAAENEPILIARQGEHGATEVHFDVHGMIETYGAGGTFVLLHKRFGDAIPYAADCTLCDGVLTWTVSAKDTAVAGWGEAEIDYMCGDTLLAKSPVYRTRCEASVGEAGALPEDCGRVTEEIVGTMVRVIAVQDAVESLSEAVAGKAEASAVTALAEAVAGKADAAVLNANINGVFRGKNLGTLSDPDETEAFLNAHGVEDGVFRDIYLGDYVTIRDGTYNAEWMVAGFDLYRNQDRGPSEQYPNNPDKTIRRHHLVLIPRTSLGNAAMEESNAWNGYANSTMFTRLAEIGELLRRQVLGDHLLRRNVYLTTGVSMTGSSNMGAGTVGCSTSASYRDVDLLLPSEVEVFGAPICSSSWYDNASSFGKLPLFNHIPLFAYQHAGFWTRCFAEISGSNFRCAAAMTNGYVGSRAVILGDLAMRPLMVLG